MKTSVSISYSGSSLDIGRMDVYEASANMIAFSEFMVAAVKSTYGESAEAKAEVAGFEHGSFVTDLVISVSGSAATVFTAFTPEQLWSVVKGAFSLWKHLKGSPPSKVTYDSSQNATVTNNSGNIIQVRVESMNLVMNEKGAAATDRFVRQALSHDGYEALTIKPDAGDAIPPISSAEAASFVSVAREKILTDHSIKVILSLVSPTFQDGNKWRVSDGSTTYSAALLDGDFLMQVNNGRRFGKGDILDVEMRIVQNLIGSKVSVERSILKVYRHLTPQEQDELF